MYNKKIPIKFQQVGPPSRDLEDRLKTILCYGDSNTWGYDAGTGGRFSPEARWPGVLRSQLGEGYAVIEEGLCGRTTVWDDPIEGEWLNGKRYLLPCLLTHAPLDLAVVMLGTNDLKMRFSASARDIAAGVETLVKLIQTSQAGPEGGSPAILILAPPPTVRMAEYEEMFTGAGGKSRQFGRYYGEVAEMYGCAFFDTSSVITSWEMDGIHLAPEEHKKLGIAVAGIVKELL